MSTHTATIQDDLFYANQSWNLTRIVKVNDDKIRVRIRRNAHNDQSFAVAELWDGAEWNEVLSRPIDSIRVGATRDNGAGTRVPVVSYTHKQLDGLSDHYPELFSADATDLINLARMVVR